MFIHEKSQAHQCLHYSPGDGSPESICKSRPTKVSHDPGQNREVCTREPIAFEWHRRISETSGTPGRLATSRVTWNGGSMVHYMWFTRSAIHVISARTLLYAGRGSIPVRTFLGSKNRLCPIRMRTQVPKFAQQSDPQCGHRGPSVARSDPDADICGDLLTKSLTPNKTKDENFFCWHQQIDPGLTARTYQPTIGSRCSILLIIYRIPHNFLPTHDSPHR